MARVQAGPGVVLETPADVEVAPIAASPRLGAAPPRPSALSAGLAAAGFAVAADFALQSHPGPALAAGPVRPAKVEVTVKADESALVLIEGPGGVYGWSYPQARAPAPAGLGLAEGGAARLTFSIGPAAAAGLGLGLAGVRGSPILDWIVGKTLGGLRARVLKFVVGKIEDMVIARVEGGHVAGLTALSGADPALWRPGGAPVTPPPAGRPARLLLMVHGTFSSTQGSFGQLTTTAQGRAFLAAAHQTYDAVLGFDHKTLGEAPEANAAAMLDALVALGLPQASHLDAVAYSRGGLVYREFAETLLPGRRPDVVLGRAAFVGCTNRGTNLAEPEHWATLVDLYTNIALAGARVIAAAAGGAALSPAISQTIQVLGQFVQYLSVVAITERRAPGLAGMEPDGALVTRLNAADGGLDRLAAYYAVTSNFVAKLDPQKGVTKELAQLILDRVTNRLFQGDNDLVVDTRSMTDFGTRQSRLAATHTFAFGAGEDVYHTVYFNTAETPTRLSEWLLAT